MLDNNDRYASMFTSFFKNSSRMASTYKPVFLKALIDIGRLANDEDKKELIGKEWLTIEDGRLLIDLNFIAVRFAKYYWDMEYSFKLRQSQDRHDANITRLVKEKHNPKKKPPTISYLSGEHMAEFRARVIRKSIRPEVLYHLRTDMPDLYERVSSNVISLDESIIRYVSRNGTSIKYGLNYVIAKYLEKINRGTPSIARKIDYEPDKINRPRLSNKLITVMCKWQNSCCFYCKTEMTRHHVDHVIPFNFVFSTEPYNCVLACAKCNCAKSDTLPERYLFDNVIERNQQKNKYYHTMKARYDEESYRNLFETCVTKYNGNTFFRPKCKSPDFIKY